MIRPRVRRDPGAIAGVTMRTTSPISRLCVHVAYGLSLASTTRLVLMHWFRTQRAAADFWDNNRRGPS